MWLGCHISCTRQRPCDEMNNKKQTKKKKPHSLSKHIEQGLIYMETVTSDSESHMTMTRHSLVCCGFYQFTQANV